MAVYCMRGVSGTPQFQVAPTRVANGAARRCTAKGRARTAASTASARHKPGRARGLQSRAGVHARHDDSAQPIWLQCRGRCRRAATVTGRNARSTAGGSRPQHQAGRGQHGHPRTFGPSCLACRGAFRLRGWPRKAIPTALTKHAAANAPVRPRALPARSAPPPTPAAPACKPTAISD